MSHLPPAALQVTELLSGLGPWPLSERERRCWQGNVGFGLSRLREDKGVRRAAGIYCSLKGRDCSWEDVCLKRSSWRSLTWNQFGQGKQSSGLPGERLHCFLHAVKIFLFLRTALAQSLHLKIDFIGFKLTPALASPFPRRWGGGAATRAVPGQGQCHRPVSWCHAADLYGRRQTQKRNLRLKGKNILCRGFVVFLTSFDLQD